jgi:hypothetical protein
MNDQARFSVRVDQNKYLAVGSSEVNAIVTVEATGGGAAVQRTEAAEVIIVDTSGSMSIGRISEAKKAAQAAVDTLRDGVHFAIVKGTSQATMVYPHQRQLVRADAQTRRLAKEAIGRLEADGGTAIGRWLRLAADLFEPHRDAIRHAILLTDGKNEHQSAAEFEADLAYCTGKFVCDCRGVGTGWVVAELRKVASALLGDVMDIPDPKDLEADFRAMTQAAMGKAVADVALRVWTPQNARLKFVKQVSPVLEDLTARRVATGPLVGDYPTGAWGTETREYHITVEVPAGVVGQEMRAAWVRLVLPASGSSPEQVLASGNVLAQWTDDLAQSTRISPRVAHYTGQEEPHKEGDIEAATARLGRARGIAERSGNEDTVKLLDKFVDIEPGTGTARLKRHVEKADEIALDTRSVRTVRMRQDPES